jgi:GTP pyrophosphokinase
VPLTYQLQNGDQIEILTAKRGGPSRDWLNTHLGYVNTSRAKAKIRYWFKHQNYEENVSQGRVILERELRRLGLSEVNYEKLAQEFKFHKVEDFLAAIGRSDIGPHQIATVVNHIAELAPTKEEEEWCFPTPLPSPPRQEIYSTGIQVQGVGNLATNLAQCCNPVPGDPEIVGYITQGRGVTIHRQDCSNLLNLRSKYPERLIAVDWGDQDNVTFPVDVLVEAFDRAGLLRDITAVVANERINMSTVNVVTKKKENKSKVYATLEIANIDQLSRVLAKLEQLPNVIEARRRK